MNKGVILHNEGKLDGALEQFNKALSLDSKDYMIWYNRCCTYIKKKELKEALTDLAEAIKIGGNETKAMAIMDKDFEEVLYDESFKKMILNPSTYT
jgi:tetratricopeptide (TPR) repeat protein